MAGSRPLGSGQISPDAGAGLTSDSSAVARADLSLHRAAPTPNCPSQCPGEEKVVFQSPKSAGTKWDQCPKNSTPQKKHKTSFRNMIIPLQSLPPSLRGSFQGVGGT